MTKIQEAQKLLTDPNLVWCSDMDWIREDIAAVLGRIGMMPEWLQNGLQPALDNLLDALTADNNIGQSELTELKRITDA